MNDQLRSTILKGIEPLLLVRQTRVLTVRPKDQESRLTVSREITTFYFNAISTGLLLESAYGFTLTTPR